MARFGPDGLRKAEKYIPDVKAILSNSFTDPISFNRSTTENEKVAAEEGAGATIKDYVIGSLMSPKFKSSLDVIKSTDPSHWKLASALPELNPTRISKLHPDTSAWLTVFTVNSVHRG